MKGVFSSNGFRVLVIIIVFFLVVALVTSGNSYVNNFVTSFVLTPIRQLVTGGVTSAGDSLTPPRSAEELQKEVDRLTEENRRLNDLLIDYYDVKAENEELEKFYDIKKENEDFSVVTATVISRDPNENFFGFTLDQGSANGVELNDPVMTENGLVGWVCEVAPKSCQVKTILSPDASIGVVDKRTTDSGILSGSAAMTDEGLTRMINVSAQNTMAIDDIIVTSGYGGIFPKNLKIGKVREMSYDSYSGLPMVVVEPFEDIKTVKNAAIVVNFSGKGEITEAEKQKDQQQNQQHNSQTGKTTQKKNGT